jgi:serine/threonine protein kinase
MLKSRRIFHGRKKTAKSKNGKKQKRQKAKTAKSKNGKKQKTKRHSKGGDLTLNDEFIELVDNKTGLVLHQTAHILGNGSYGRVILATCKDSKYAIKESMNKMMPSLEAQLKYDRARQNEYVILRNNANKQNLIFTNYDEIIGKSIKDNSREAQYIITEPVCNTSLTVDSVKKLTIAQKIDLIKQLYNAITTLHSYNVCHRDIKPDNILLKYETSGDINLYLTDFGLCTLFSGSPPFDSENFPNDVGTLKTKAPELFSKSKEYGLDSDWWGFGMIIHFILFNTLPTLIQEKTGWELRELLDKMADDDSTLDDFISNLHNEIDTRQSEYTNCVILIKKCLNNRDSRLSIKIDDVNNLSNDIQSVHVRETHTLYRNNAYHYIKNINPVSELLSTRRVVLNVFSDTIVNEILREKNEINTLNPRFKKLFLSKLSEKIKNGFLTI